MVATPGSWSQNPLPYARRLEKRDLAVVDCLVLHCTELPDLATARIYGKKIHYPDSQTGNCGHFYIDRDGHVEQWVPLDRVAHHVRGHNRQTIGIELVNTGRYPHWLHADHQVMCEPYPDVQISALVLLIQQLVSAVPSLQAVTGHEELDQEWVAASNAPHKRVRRKLDPGPMFPWHKVLDHCPLQRHCAIE